MALPRHKRYLLKGFGMDHGGRVQAQGKNLEHSKRWDQDMPLLASMGREMLEAIRHEIGKREADFRSRGFDQAHVFIDRMERIGGAGPTPPPIKKSFPQPPLPEGRRVDIEVHRGIAFVPAGNDHRGEVA